MNLRSICIRMYSINSWVYCVMPVRTLSRPVIQRRSLARQTQPRFWLSTKRSNQQTRLKEIGQVQGALDAIGSIHNISLTHLARTGRTLYVEGPSDFRILRRFARRLGYAQLAIGNDITPIESGGFSSWKKIEASAWAFERTLHGQFRIGVLFDRDYFPDEEIEEVRKNLAGHFHPVHIHERKELENYMLSPEPLDRAARKALREPRT